MEGTEVKTRRSAVQQLVDAAQPRHEPEVEQAIDDFQEARARSREALMLDVRLADGKIASFDYGRLADSEFLPEGKFILRFGRKEITAEGKNLLRVYTTITEHRQRSIQEGTDIEEKLKPEDAPHIDKITIRVGVEE